MTYWNRWDHGGTAGSPPRWPRWWAPFDRRRVSRVQRTAEKQGRIYHMSGPMALARDMTIKALGPRRMLARQSWIYDWRV